MVDTPTNTVIDIWNFSFQLPCELGRLKPVNLQCDISELVFLEIFAGSGNLSKAARDVGLSIHPVDSTTKRQTGVAMHVLDLTKDSDASVLLDLVCNANIASGHLAPPCGTSSRSREKPLPAELSHIKSVPLRSDEHPLGLQGLTNLDAIRVGAANRLYALTLLIACILHIRGASLSIENPRGSHFWTVLAFFAKLHPWMDKILKELETNDFQACMYGGKRDKWTSFKGTASLYSSICKVCDGSHTHESWKPRASGSSVIFPTASEAEYPMELCRTMMSCLEVWLQQRGAKFSLPQLTEDTTISARQLRQFGKRQLPPLLSEYWLVTDSHLAEFFPQAKPLSTCPPGLKRGVDEEKVGELDIKLAEALEEQYAKLPGTVVRHLATDNPGDIKWYGVHRNHLQAFQATLQLQHPMDMQVPIPDILQEAMFNVLTMGAAKILEMRALQCKRILRLVSDLDADEKKLHEGMPKDVQSVLRGKRILLWKRLLEETNFPDLHIVDEVVDGLKLVGSSTKSGAFPSGVYPAQQTVEQLSQQSIWRRKSSIGKCRPTDDAEADDELWAQSLKEAEQGWLSGPFSSEREVTEALKTDNWICTRRFPLRQSNKIRLIDDGLESGLNSAYSSFNKLKLMDMDSVVAMVQLLLQSIHGKGRFCFRLSDGRLLEGMVHSDWRRNPKLLGRTLDLTAAYKQLAVDPKQSLIRALVAYNPEKKAPAFFIFNALPFGATGSVYGFNRVAKSLWHIMVTLGNVFATQYYDDYPNVEFSSLARSSQNFMEFILQALGWKFATDGKKACPPESSFKVLGVELDLSQTDRGTLIVANKQDRIENLTAFLAGLMKRGRISGSEAATLHGQLNFAQGQYYGCSMKPAMSFLQTVMRTSWKNSYSQDLVVMCTYLVTSLLTCPPRVISTTDSKQPVILFTDGAFEVEDGVGIGSAGLVFFDPLTNVKEVAEVDVPQSLISHWGRGGSKQLIAFLELWPVLLGIITYGPHIRGRRLLVFIDNNGVRDALIKGSSPLIDLFTMLSLCSLAVSVNGLSVWFTRIPSSSNPSDDPSRGEPERVAKLLGANLRHPISASEGIIESLLSKSDFVKFMQGAAHDSSLVQPNENGGGARLQ